MGFGVNFNTVQNNYSTQIDQKDDPTPLHEDFPTIMTLNQEKHRVMKTTENLMPWYKDAPEGLQNIKFAESLAKHHNVKLFSFLGGEYKANSVTIKDQFLQTKEMSPQQFADFLISNHADQFTDENVRMVFGGANSEQFAHDVARELNKAIKNHTIGPKSLKVYGFKEEYASSTSVERSAPNMNGRSVKQSFPPFKGTGTVNTIVRDEDLNSAVLKEKMQIFDFRKSEPLKSGHKIEFNIHGIGIN